MAGGAGEQSQGMKQTSFTHALLDTRIGRHTNTGALIVRP